MKNILLIFIVAVFVFANCALSFAGETQKTCQGPKGPAPNSGDGVPDGSGF